jgi:hypothetical protein
MPERRFALTWSRTWPDRPHDFSAKDGEIPIGRVYRLTGGPADRSWRWTMTAYLDDGRQGSASGVVASRDEACKAVEEAYRRMAGL